MYLKSLVLKGFKSFANRSVLSLEPGLTVIVGPNGSGKSNIADAVLWVLGEQSARQLRGQAMEDVIFAGSSARQAVGVAEVDMVLDNSDNTLPLDFDEVVITRRMYRSGESEYLINGSPSRRVDILDILSDVGLGRDAHAIISQGSLQTMLQARPEDRRALIEEAAGISKHKKRKERSLRRMENMETQLERVRDIAAEIDRQLKPLERQASRAEQYEALDAELKELDLSLAVDDLRQLQDSWRDIEQREKEGDAAVELARYRAEEKSQELEKYQRLLEEKGLFVGDLAEQRRRCQAVLERLDAGMLLVEEKGRNMVARLSELRQSIHQSDTRIAQAQEQFEELQVNKAEITGRREALYSQLSDLQKESEGIRRQRKAADEDLSRLSSALRAREKALDDNNLRLAKINDRLSTADTEDELLQSRDEQIDDSLTATQSTLASRRSRIEELEEELDKLERDSQLAKLDIDKRVRLLDDARKDLETKRDALNAINAEIKGLEEVDRAFEAASPTLSWIEEHKDELHGIVSPVSEIFSAPPEYENLVEQLLGADIFGLMMEDADAAAKLAERILDEEGTSGEVALLPLGIDHKRPKSSSGKKRLLDELTYEKRYAQVAESLLGDVYLVDSIQDAFASARLDATGARFVTEEGAVLWPNGKLTVGMQISDTEGVLVRRRRLNTLNESLPAATEEVGDAELAVSEAESNLQVAQADDFDISQKAAQASGEADSLREEVGRLEQNITALMQEREEIAARRQKALDDSAAARGETDDINDKIKEVEAEKAEIEEELASVTEQRDRLFEEESGYTQQTSQIQVDLATVQEREVYTNKQIDQLAADIEQLQHSLDVSRETERSLEILRLRVEPLHELYSDIREGATGLAELLRDRANLEQAGQGDLRESIEELRAGVRDYQERLDKEQENLTQVRIDKSKLEVQVENAVDVITNDYGVLLDIALETPAPEDRDEVQKRADSLRRRLSHIGSVDPVAVDEYRSLKERRDFISVQLEDLEGAKSALDRIVKAIDRKLRNRFVDTFNLVNENFQEIFSELFPGGKGYLELDTPENPEESGVEVYAQPRGKIVKQQMLLSGGEKAMASLALLFAVYRTRSTPFYILDEVEAALDDTNLRRLLAYLDSVREVSQVIMISHQRRTMEMADLLYGVSMRSDGVSKLVSQKLDQALRQATDAPDEMDVEAFSGAE